MRLLKLVGKFVSALLVGQSNVENIIFKIHFVYFEEMVSWESSFPWDRLSQGSS